MQLSNFTVFLPGKHEGKVLIDVYHDIFSKNIEITVEYECSTTKKTVEILFDYFENSWFSYKESVENEEYEVIDIPDFLDYVKHLVLPENEMFEVIAVIDENGIFKRNITNLILRYKGLANISLMNQEQCKDIPVLRDPIIPGETLILKNDKYTAIFDQANINRLDWYILSRSTNQWRAKERVLRKHPRNVYPVRKSVSA